MTKTFRSNYSGAVETACGVCGVTQWCEPHHVFAGTARRISDKYGAVVYLCRNCHEEIHNNPAAFKWLQAETQAKVMAEQGWTLEDWMNHFHKNYGGEPND